MRKSLIMTLILMFMAIFVFVGKCRGEDMWIPTAVYWAGVSLKYVLDWFSQRTQAEWIYCGDDLDEQSWYCSKCQTIQRWRYPHCPTCGAKMDTRRGK